jgi:hypothetical protein
MDFSEIYDGLPNERVEAGGDTQLKLSNGWLIQPLPYIGDQQLSNSIEIIIRSPGEPADDAHATITQDRNGHIFDPWGVMTRLPEADQETVRTLLSRIPRP